jgi:hypothetical protein
VPPKHPDSDPVEANKIGRDHLAGGGKMGAVHRIFTNDPPKTSHLWKKMRHYETFLVV